MMSLRNGNFWLVVAEDVAMLGCVDFSLLALSHHRQSATSRLVVEDMAMFGCVDFSLLALNHHHRQSRAKGEKG